MDSPEQPNPGSPDREAPSEAGSETSDLQFEGAKQRYFVGLAVGLKPALEAHRREGMLDKDENNERSWGNVTEHCLVEAARVRELAGVLALPEEMSHDLMLAAALHDFFKSSEVKIAAAGKNSWDSYEEASRQSKQKMEEAGFSPRVVRLANSVGHGSMLETEALLEKPELDDEEVAYLVMHYVDDYTSGTDWVDPDRDPLAERVQKNIANTRMGELNEAGRKFFSGTTTFDRQLELGREVAARLAAIAAAKTHLDIESSKLPLAVDQKIRERIKALR